MEFLLHYNRTVLYIHNSKSITLLQCTTLDCIRNNNYRPQRSWAKVMFLQASVILSTGGGVSASVHAGIHPPRADTPLPEQAPLSRQSPRADTPLGADNPLEETPPGADTPWDQTPPGVDTPQSRHPPEQTPQSRHPLGTDPPPPGADSGIRSTSGRYASYWNAFLLNHCFSK